MHGFQNDGNTCWFNAAIQALLHTPQLVNYALADTLYGDDLYKKRMNACAMATEFAALARSYWSTETKKAPSAVPLRTAFCKVKKSMAAPRQEQDAHEAILGLLETMHAALAKVVRVREPPPTADHGAWTTHNEQQGYSLLTEMFMVQTEMRDRPGVFDHVWGLSLPVAEASSVSQALAAMDVTIRHPPLTLMLHINRFDAAGNKINKFVNYTIEMTLEGKKYALYAIILHSGEARTGGHYTAMVQHQGTWTFVNDAACTPVTDINTVIQKDAYVLLYKRLD